MNSAVKIAPLNKRKNKTDHQTFYPLMHVRTDGRTECAQFTQQN